MFICQHLYSFLIIQRKIIIKKEGDVTGLKVVINLPTTTIVYFNGIRTKITLKNVVQWWFILQLKTKKNWKNKTFWYVNVLQRFYHVFLGYLGDGSRGTTDVEYIDGML